jgi:hypothetical protein
MGQQVPLGWSSLGRTCGISLSSPRTKTRSRFSAARRGSVVAHGASSLSGSVAIYTLVTLLIPTPRGEFGGGGAVRIFLCRSLPQRYVNTRVLTLPYLYRITFFIKWCFTCVLSTGIRLYFTEIPFINSPLIGTMYCSD